jgi:riboflavin-specific deaminase-like protein
MLLPARAPASAPDHALRSAADAWALLLALARLRRSRGLPDHDADFRLLADGTLAEAVDADPRIAARWRPHSGWSVPGEVGDPARAMLDLYLPACSARPERPFVIAHLGQSIDGRIATESGDSRFVTGESNRRHLHRLRALCDAVVVGAGTIATDDPLLTTRLVPGDDPVRVVLDPSFRIRPTAGVLTDRRAPTIVAVDAAYAHHAAVRAGAAEIVGAPCQDGSLDLRMLLATLSARGLDALFVEGGGVTVSRFLEAGLVDTLQIAIAAVIIGSGRPGLQRRAVPSMRDCPRPAGRVFRMGEDLLWSFDLRAPPDGTPPPDASDLERIF